MVDTIFSEYPDGMYFDEFETFAREVSSELYVAVFDCLYQYVPCIQNFFMIKTNFMQML